MIYLIQLFTAPTTEEEVEKYQHILPLLTEKVWQATNSKLGMRFAVLTVVLLQIQVL
jgi:hypothetical protein